jgi:hypothetical protein
LIFAALQHAAELLEFEIKDLEEALTLLRMQSMAAVINLSKGKVRGTILLSSHNNNFLGDYFP